MSKTDATENGRLLATYWGKADPAAAVADRNHHTVLAHSLDVAACSFTLLKQNARLGQQLAACMGLEREPGAATVAAMCALHDIGKLDTRFQRKAPQIADVLRPHTASIPTGVYDHGTEGFRQIEQDDVRARRLQQSLGDSALPILRAVCGHHGALPSRDEADPSRANLPRAVRREDERARDAFQDCVCAFFASIGAVLPFPGVADGPLVQRLAGLCAISDWLGSNVGHFPYEPGPIDELEAYWSRACARAMRACHDAGLVRAAPSRLDFSGLFPGYSPRDVQLLTEQVRIDEAALVVVEAEMGKGKTEAALSLAARTIEHSAVDGVTIALPTMATSNAMFARVEDVVRRIFPSGDVQLALAHSRASRHDGFRALLERPLRALDPDAPEASVTCARWLLNRKRILLAQVGVGTIDQSLQAALVVRHQFVRMFGLSRNVVIIDEVHAYDAYMEVLLEHLLEWLGALDVPVILLSATLPSERRAALARAWRGIDGAGEPVDDLTAARTRAYPMVSVSTRRSTTTLTGAQAPDSRSILVERVSSDQGDHVQATARRLLAAATTGARVVWIRNTVREAQDAFRAVARSAGEVEHWLFHARFRGCDRTTVERAVLERFGKSAPAGGRVLIATQVVEQSLDLDFDELHTDLAPIDLIFQRSGRLHRHTRSRPSGFEKPRLVIHGPSAATAADLRFGPSKFVYDAGTLWITDRALRLQETLALPTDIRRLVEDTYHPVSRATLIPLGGSKLVEAEAQRINELEARRTRAKQCCIPPTSADPDGGRLLPDDDEAVQAFTRDGMSVTLLPCLWNGHCGRTLDARSDDAWHLDASHPTAWQLTSMMLDQTLSLPSRGVVEGAVESTEASAWAAWRQQFMRFAEDAGMGRRLAPLPMKKCEAGYKGWLRSGGRLKRVMYTPTLGLWMLNDKDEES